LADYINQPKLLALSARSEADHPSAMDLAIHVHLIGFAGYFSMN
jgi:hypothetical protein